MSVAPTHDYTPGSDEDFDRLYRSTYQRLVRSLGVMMGDWAEAEDCVQDAYARAYTAWPRWRPDAPAEAWLWRITLNVAHTRMGQRKRRGIGEVLRRLGRPGEGTDPGEVALGGDISGALRQLAPREASTVVLRHLHGYSNIEIAGFLGVDVRTVTRLMTRGMDRLRDELGEAWRMSSAGVGDAVLAAEGGEA